MAAVWRANLCSTCEPARPPPREPAGAAPGLNGAVGYDRGLADRVRGELVAVKRVTEQEMFGGLAFMVAGNMCCGVLGDDLLVRVGPDLYHDALTRPYVSETDAHGRAVRGTVYVGRPGVADDAE